MHMKGILTKQGTYTMDILGTGILCSYHVYTCKVPASNLQDFQGPGVGFLYHPDRRKDLKDEAAYESPRFPKVGMEPFWGGQFCGSFRTSRRIRASESKVRIRTVCTGLMTPFHSKSIHKFSRIGTENLWY